MNTYRIDYTYAEGRKIGIDTLWIRASTLRVARLFALDYLKKEFPVAKTFRITGASLSPVDAPPSAIVRIAPEATS